MKKISLLAMSFGLLYGSTSMAQAPRIPLIEEFTQASCPNCPRANTYLNPLLATYPLGQVVAIKYQVNYPGVDTLNLQNPTDAGANSNNIPTGRALPYDILGVPAAVLDGDTSFLTTPSTNDYSGDPNNLTSAMIGNEQSLTTPITLTATFNYNAATDSFTSRVVVTNVSGSTVNSSATGNLKLFFSLEEMNIHFSPDDHPGDNGEADFYYIDRKMYPSVNGTTLPDAILSGDSVVYTFKYKVPAYIYNKMQLGVASFVQDMGLPRTSQSVLQAVFATSPNVTDAVMTDNTTYPTTSAVCNVSFTPSLTLTNNGTTTITSATVGYYLGSNTATTQSWTGSLANGQSTTITFPAITAPDNTYSNASYFVNNLNGGTLIDVNDANNTPVSTGFIISIPAVATIDSIGEDFEASVGYLFTPISINSQSSSNAFGFGVNETYIYDYVVGGGAMSSTSQAGGYAQSPASFLFCLACAQSGSVDALVFDKVDRTGRKNSNIVFDHAYAPYNSSSDVLSVKVSNDCGVTWSTAWTQSGTTLATSPSVDLSTTGFFVPTATQWVTDTVDMTSYNDRSDIIVEFEATTHGGNALYVDNINWAEGTINTGIKNVASVVGASVYPNPASGNVNLTLNTSQSANFDITIINTLGENVMNVSNGQINAGTRSMDVNVAALAAGAYNFVIKSNGETMVRRFVVAN